MDIKMKKIILFFLIFVSLGANAQTGVYAGFSLLKPFNDNKPFTGIHVGLEFPRDESTTFFIKFTNYFRVRDTEQTEYFLFAKDPSVIPYQISVNSRYSSNFLTVEGGTRYYFVGTYDFGFGMYGGTDFILGYSSVKFELDSYDEAVYEDPSDEPNKGGVILLGLGLQGGLKYTVPNVGSFFLEPGGLLSIYAQPSNNTGAAGYRGSQIFLNLSIGFRKDFF